MSKFQLGDKVTQSAQSNFRHNTESNPINVTGEIVEVRDPESMQFHYKVKWPNGRINSYNAPDLDLVATPVAKIDVLASAKRLQELREQQSALTSEITELVDQIRKDLEGTGLTLVEDIPVAATTMLQVVADESIEIGDEFLCTVEEIGEHIAGRVYAVVDLDKGDSAPVKLESEDGCGWWVSLTNCANYTKVD